MKPYVPIFVYKLPENRMSISLSRKLSKRIIRISNKKQIEPQYLVAEAIKKFLKGGKRK